MGDPKLPKKKYKTPSHPWQRVRIDEEKDLMKEYGVKNKKEIWKMNSVLKNFHEQAKSLIVSRTSQADRERIQMMERLASYGLVEKTSNLDTVLGLTIKNVMDLRLQTLIMKQGLAHSIGQARQYITHRHVMIGEKVITSPSYLVKSEERPLIRFAASSALADTAHPMRVVEAKKAAPEGEGGEAKGAPRRGPRDFRGRPGQRGGRQQGRRGGPPGRGGFCRQRSRGPRQERPGRGTAPKRGEQ